MKFAYKKISWLATDIRGVEDDYKPGEGEFILDQDFPPTQESLSDPKPESVVALEQIVEEESKRQITQRELREFILAAGDSLGIQAQAAYVKASAAEAAIAPKRAKL